jgi:hypothetical protein
MGKLNWPLIITILACVAIVAATIGFGILEESSPNHGCEGVFTELKDGSAECVVDGEVVWRRP